MQNTEKTSLPELNILFFMDVILFVSYVNFSFLKY